MIEIKQFDENCKPSPAEKNGMIQFLYQQLERFGDSASDIESAINYALKEIESFGGFVLQGLQEGQLASVVVVNRTGMKDYIPENILVYIATHSHYRGKGIGKEMMLKAIDTAQGNIALHVEPDNPAKYLYEKIGFKSKYLEMRFKKEEQ